MIFVTVGTHEQQFNRLVKYMDEWAACHDEEVIIQTGFSDYQPSHSKWQSLYSYSEMNDNIKGARIVITHGGPSSFIAPLQIGKIPIVVPRNYAFEEHVNNHQVDFCKQVAERQGNIIVVECIDDLGRIIEEYEKTVSCMTNEISSNNEHFCNELATIVDELVR